MDQRERMLRGLPYRAFQDGLGEDRERCKEKVWALNNLPPCERDKIPGLLKELFGRTGKSCWVEPPFHCDYGWNIWAGENFFANYNLTVLDVCRVTFGDNVMIAPNVSIYAAGHPIHPDSRNSGYEYGLPVTVGNNVWIGGSAVILAGVTIGDNAVIGAGSVVTRDVPPGVVAAGNPCRVIRAITEADRKYYCGDREFDVDDYGPSEGGCYDGAF